MDPNASHKTGNLSEYLDDFSNQLERRLHLATIDGHLVFVFHVFASIMTFHLERCVGYDEDMVDVYL